MEKLDCIEDYFLGIRAYYLFYDGQYRQDYEHMKYILDNDMLNGAKVAFLSNMMLAIKEDLVDNKGGRVYESRIFLDSLESCLSYIAKKTDSGYQVGGFDFPDGATAVAIIRNKLAHGQYVIDYKNGEVVFNHKGVDIPVSINALCNFVVAGFGETIFYNRTKKYERDYIYYIKPKNQDLSDLAKVRSAIKGFNYVKFTIESTNEYNIPKVCITAFEKFFKCYKSVNYIAPSDQIFVKFKKFLESLNCKLSVDYSGLKDRREIDAVLDYANAAILNDSRLDYDTKMKFIGSEVHRRIDNRYNQFNTISACRNNLILLDAISKTNSIKYEDLSTYIAKIYPDGLRLNYDDLGMVLISMFNSLFLYPYDDIYDIKGGYKLDRSDEFDFSKLDLSMVNASYLNYDKTPLNEAQSRCDKIVRRQVELTDNLNRQKENLKRVSGDAVNKINQSINKINNELSALICDYTIAFQAYSEIKDDYDNNSLYFKNKAIIEGIRNSMAHGNYEIIGSGSFDESIILFKDIYDGKVTFQLDIKFSDFSKLIEKNYLVLLNYVNKKRGLSGNNVRSK